MWQLLMVNVKRVDEFKPIKTAAMHFIMYGDHENAIRFQCFFIVVENWTEEIDICFSGTLEQVMKTFCVWESHANRIYWNDCVVEVPGKVCNIYYKKYSEVFCNVGRNESEI